MKLKWEFDSFHDLSKGEHITYYRTEVDGVEAFKYVHCVFVDGVSSILKGWMAGGYSFKSEEELIEYLSE